MNEWTGLATALFEFNRELMISGFPNQEALFITTELAKTIAIESIRTAAEGHK